MRAIAHRLLATLLLACSAPMFVPQAIAASAAGESEGINPRYVLMDVRGRAATNTRFPDRFQLLTFGYAASPDVSPTALAEMAEVMQGLGAQAARVQALFISVDPSRDLPSKLQRFVNLFDTRIIGLSGNDALTARVIENYKLHVEIVRAPEAAPDDYRVNYSSGMILLDPSGNFLRKFPFGTPVVEITAALETLVAQAPSGER